MKSEGKREDDKDGKANIYNCSFKQQLSMVLERESEIV